MSDIFFFSPIESWELNVKLPVFKRDNKPVYYNFYGADLQGKYEIIETATTILVRKIEEGFYRLYICSTNHDELLKFLLLLDNNKYVLNIPTKKGTDSWDALLEESGFEPYAKYDRYYNTQIEKRESDIGVTAESDDVDGIMNLIYCDEFSVYTDYLPSKSDILEMISNNQVIVNKKDNQVKGVIIYTIEGRKCYLNLWIDRSGEGLYLLFDVYNIMIEKGLKYAYFWAKSTNKKVIKIHKLTGAVPDGTSDYTFIKNL